MPRPLHHRRPGPTPTCEPLEPRTLLSGLPWSGLPAPSIIDTGSSTPITADFDGDGAIDLAVSSGRSLRFHKGNGDGTFANPVALTQNADIGAIAIGRFDGDDRPDIASVVTLPGGKLLTRVMVFDAILGRFKVSARIVSQNAFPAQILQTTVQPELVVGNFVGGWRDEIVIRAADLFGTRFAGESLLIRVISKTRLADLGSIGYVFPLSRAAAADLNKDGLDEILFADNTTIRRVSFLNGRFTETQSPLYQTARILQFKVADMTGDGALDIFVLQDLGFTQQRRPLALLVGDGFGTIAFKREWNDPTSLGIQRVHAIQDVNNDGRLDIVGENVSSFTDRGGTTTRSTLQVLLDDGAEGWTPQGLAASDVSIIGLPDLSGRFILAALTGSTPDLLDRLRLGPGNSPMRIRPSSLGEVAPRLAGGAFRLGGFFGSAQNTVIATISTTTAHSDLGGNLRRVEVVWDRNNNGTIDDGEQVVGSADGSSASQNVLRVAALLTSDARSAPVFRLLARGVGIDGTLSNIADLGSVTWSP